jgi:hypothetical protein
VRPRRIDAFAHFLLKSISPATQSSEKILVMTARADCANMPAGWMSAKVASRTACGTRRPCGRMVEGFRMPVSVMLLPGVMHGEVRCVAAGVDRPAIGVR